MKKVKLYAMAFAAMIFAASCQDDLTDPGQNTGNGGDGTPAYLTISFSTNGESSTRSTADDANNQGDYDGDQEDSGHKNSGTDDERRVDKVLVVITPAEGGNVNFAKLYSTSTSENEDDPTGSGIYDVTNTVEGSTYANDEVIELTTGKYNVLVVANPVDDIITNITNEDLNEGIFNSNAVEDLYRRITTEQYAPSEDNYKKISNGQELETDAGFRIMMANKSLNTNEAGTDVIELTETNDADNPATAHVKIERMYSKITFRETNKNVYTVPVYVGEVEARLVDAAILKAELTGQTGTSTTAEDVNDTYEYRQLNAALDYAGHEVYVLWEATSTEDETPVFKGVFGETSETVDGLNVDQSNTKNDVIVYKKLTAITDEDQYEEGTNYVIQTSGQETSGLTYLSDEVTPKQTWYVRLEGYALVNLSKSVYYVRHTTDATGQSPFGTLTGSNYLYTPWWNEKNDDGNIVADDNGNPVFKEEEGNPISEKWFYNTLAQVSDESKSLTIDGSNIFKVGNNDAQYYKAMPTEEGQNGDVTGDGDKGQHTDNGNTLPNVGKFMSYCFENSTDVDHQLHGISTGISFVARIYGDPNCEQEIKTLYRYDNHLFESLEAIQKSYGANLMSKKFNWLVDQEVINDDGSTNITRADLEALANYQPTDDSDSDVSAVGDANKNGEQIDMYADGICYYYTTEIKHYDNGDNASLGNMEFAIMRNNIYSLAVTSINEIGDPYVDPTPDTPNENPEAKTALNVEVKIVPWIVRYNDIEF